MQRFVDDVVTIEEPPIVEALRLIMTRAKLAAEPSGAATVAALLSGAVTNVVSPVVAIVSGGNVDPETLARIL